MSKVKTAKTAEKPQERYLKIPNHILNIPGTVLNTGEKILLAHIYSFGVKGCYQSNKVISETFWVSVPTITRRIAKLQQRGFVQVKCPKSYYRTMYAKSHPDVKTAAKLWYRGKEIPNTEAVRGHTASTQVNQNHPSKQDKKNPLKLIKSDEQPNQNCGGELIKSDVRLNQKRLTTNNITTKETTTATTPPKSLPAWGQPSAVLEDRKEGQQTIIERFKAKLGRGKQVSKPISREELEKRKEANLMALGCCK